MPDNLRPLIVNAMRIAKFQVFQGPILPRARRILMKLRKVANFSIIISLCRNGAKGKLEQKGNKPSSFLAMMQPGVPVSQAPAVQN